MEYKEFLTNMGNRYVAKIVEILKREDKVSTGRLIDSIDFTIGGEEGKHFINLIMEDYWYYVDQGRHPGKGVPKQSLLEWMRIKGIPESAYYAINYTIKRDGIQGIYFMQRAIDEIERDLEQQATDLTDQFEEEMYKQLKNDLKIN